MPSSLPPSRPPGEPAPKGPEPAPTTRAEVAPNRKLFRPSLDRANSPSELDRRRRPRMTPPDTTGLEAAHYAKQVNVGTVLLVTMEDGAEYRGVLDWHDRDALRLVRKDAPAVVIMKRAIRHTRRDDAEEAQRRA